MIKHYTEKELLEKFNKLSNEEKVKVLNKALDYTHGSKNWRIFKAMGYSYSDDYDTPTYIKV